VVTALLHDLSKGICVAGSETRDVVLYDADCGFCRWALGVLLRWDRPGRLRAVALQDGEAQRLLGGMSAEQRMDSMHVVGGQDGRVASGGAALVALARVLPGGAPLAAAGERMPGAVERGYRLVAGHRTLLGPLVRASARRRADERIAARARR
jgi:predicted DCC family thiol-disulfide oxidoreductase YuxK